MGHGEFWRKTMKYTESHEWIEVNGKIGTVGITSYAQKELGEVVFLELPIVGSKIKSGEESVVLESTKAAADIYSPVSGIIVKVNEELLQSPEKLNSHPEDSGWLYQIEITNPNELDQLLSKEQYQELSLTTLTRDSEKSM